MIFTIEIALILLAVLIAVVLILIFIISNNKRPYIISQFYSLGTLNELKVSGRNAEKAIKESIQRLSEIDDKMSVFKEYSEISAITLYF